ncbi:hypothetical protein BAUCODRAFT_524359 [Baudoinia panamericana UAMH 10762]|uniref:Uncharacterized protein n=1 Tax=Baudoinia panamericana (strain UAMH 10762) TaxID=717646 RepID=M2N8C1_BAUPA|nr:uncharacterized protein BAUCODRAFT_524359 [Baudoinia panamericana UAMH 10762]EMC95055.1 hypothetical protein BAUCODRAFT_524359 [Baudoinia panamericana UAMH 10762]
MAPYGILCPEQRLHKHQAVTSATKQRREVDRGSRARRQLKTNVTTVQEAHGEAWTFKVYDRSKGWLTAQPERLMIDPTISHSSSTRRVTHPLAGKQHEEVPPVSSLNQVNCKLH